MEEYMIPCMSKKLFGMDCMGCGTQRAFALLLKGDPIAAFHMFPAIFTTVLLFGFIGMHFVDRSRSYHKFIVGLAITNAVIMIISYIYKITNL
ncbi:MAG TPA: DUF2752 domain-containing protein [Flavobacterium sp.]|jgi:hypothetical protein